MFQHLRKNLNHNFRKIYFYSVAATSEAAFVFGGRDGVGISDVIAKFKNQEWSIFGNLKRRRSHHGSIKFGSQFMIIGGWTNGGK